MAYESNGDLAIRSSRVFYFCREAQRAWVRRRRKRYRARETEGMFIDKLGLSSP